MEPDPSHSRDHRADGVARTAGEDHGRGPAGDRLGPYADPDEAYELVTGRMQDALDQLADARAFPVIG